MNELAKFDTKVEFSIGLVTSEATGKKALVPSEVLTAVAFELGNRGIDGFSVVSVQGYWKGEPEPSLLVSFYASGIWQHHGKIVAAVFAEIFEQEAVLINVTPTNNALLIGA